MKDSEIKNWTIIIGLYDGFMIGATFFAVDLPSITIITGVLKAALVFLVLGVNFILIGCLPLVPAILKKIADGT